MHQNTDPSRMILLIGQRDSRHHLIERVLKHSFGETVDLQWCATNDMPHIEDIPYCSIVIFCDRLDDSTAETMAAFKSRFDHIPLMVIQESLISNHSISFPNPDVFDSCNGGRLRRDVLGAGLKLALRVGLRYPRQRPSG